MAKRSPGKRMRMAPLAAVLLIACSGCEREERNLRTLPSQATTVGAASAAQPQTGVAQPARLMLAGHYERNAYAVSQGRQLFNIYNCSGCHAQGGGGSGPALMDDLWIYGAEPENVFASIVWGRPNGMPSFGRHIPEYQVWQIVAYVRSMTGLISADAAPGRSDAMQAKPSEQLADTQPPRRAGASVDPKQAK